MEYEFYESDNYGLIRACINGEDFSYPEILKDGQWIKGNQYIMDAIIGMGEDAYSSGGAAFPISKEKAQIIAEKSGVSI